MERKDMGRRIEEIETRFVGVSIPISLHEEFRQAATREKITATALLRKLALDLQKLSSEDRNRLAEGSISGKIKVIRGYDDQNEFWVPIPKLECGANMALLQRFHEEGKIKGLDKDGLQGDCTHGSWHRLCTH
jgi:hypothetical protein